MDYDNITETAWMYCRECNKFDNGEHPDRPCSGKPFDFEIVNGIPPCERYEYDKRLDE